VSVPGRLFQPSQTFVSKARAHLNKAPLKVRPGSYPQRLGWKSLSGPNAQTYCDHSFTRQMFIISVPIHAELTASFNYLVNLTRLLQVEHASIILQDMGEKNKQMLKLKSQVCLRDKEATESEGEKGSERE
jgi:hypothetical protein